MCSEGFSFTSTSFFLPYMADWKKYLLFPIEDTCTLSSPLLAPHELWGIRFVWECVCVYGNVCMRLSVCVQARTCLQRACCITASPMRKKRMYLLSCTFSISYVSHVTPRPHTEEVLCHHGARRHNLRLGHRHSRLRCGSTDLSDGGRGETQPDLSWRSRDGEILWAPTDSEALQLNPPGAGPTRCAVGTV